MGKFIADINAFFPVGQANGLHNGRTRDRLSHFSANNDFLSTRLNRKNGSPGRRKTPVVVLGKDEFIGMIRRGGVENRALQLLVENFAD